MKMALLNNFIAQHSKSLRDGKIGHLLEFLKPDSLILDVGVWDRMPEPNPSENWLEKRYAGKVQIITVGLGDMHAFRDKYSVIECVQADGCTLPFKTGAVTAGFSNAVLEHIPVERQHQFVEELTRVVRHRAVIAVPDRFSPIEIHSRTFFLHWLPNWRYLLRRLGQQFWASEENLSTIFTVRSLRKLLSHSSCAGHWQIKRQWLLIFPVSLIAIFDHSQESMDGS
jgi:hypothetical protein